MGIDEKRVQMHHVSAAEATKLADIIDTVCVEIMELNEKEGN